MKTLLSTKSPLFSLGIAFLLLIAIGFAVEKIAPPPPEETPSPMPTATPPASEEPSPTAPETPAATPSPEPPTPAPTPTPAPSGLEQPVAGFFERATKKQFGTYVTPQNSPVQPERFTGYHTGIDVEYEDTAADIPVVAVAAGTIRAAQTIDGYGGVLVLSFSHQGQAYLAVYGHLRPSSLPTVGRTVSQGEQLAVLGTGYSGETSGERKHLHFAVLRGTTLDWRGYVQSESELVKWIDPWTLYPGR